jgi:3-oxoacyl-[acyl-carrier protein] reductase
LENLKGKNAFITGATSGLGREIANQLYEAGCNLFVVGRNAVELDRLRSDLGAVSCLADLSDETEVLAACKAANTELGTIDIVVNCAGVFPLQNIAETTLEQYDRCMNINVRAPFIISRYFMSEMKSKGWGRILNVGSSSAYGGSADAGIYCTSKHALLGLTRSLYQELRNDGVRVYSFSPGSIRTPMGLTDHRQDHSTFLDPKEVAEYAIFIMSHDNELIAEEIRVNRIEVR